MSKLSSSLSLSSFWGKHVALAAIVTCACLRAAEPARIVLVAGPDSHGWGQHEHAAGVKLLADALNAAGLGVRADVSAGWPAVDALKGAKSVVVFGDGGEGNLLNDHLDDLAALTAEGTGFVCLHYALETGTVEHGMAMINLLGGTFEVNWSVNPMWTPDPVRLAEHAVTRGVSPFVQYDEWYYHMRFRDGMKGVTPVLSALPPADSLADEDGPRCGNPALRKELAGGVLQHLAWATENANGSRAFGFTGGHFHATWANDNVRKLVLNAIVWTAGIDVPAKGVASETPIVLRHKSLLAAISKGDVEDVERHIQAGADVDEANKVGWTPLHYACVRNRAEVAEVLLKHGANINAVTSKGVSCLHFCVQRDYTDLAKLLIKHKASLDIGDSDGWTPLHHAGAKDRIEMAKLLLDHGAKVNALSTRGGTPLHEASASGSAELIKLLIDRGGDKSIKAQNGKTALDYAIELGNEEGAKVLR